MVDLFDVIDLKSEEDKKINEAIKELFDFEEQDVDIKTKTDLSINDIKKLTRLKLIADIYDINVINRLCDIYCLFLVSKNRLGRNEIVDIARKKEELNQDSENRLKRMFKL